MKKFYLQFFLQLISLCLLVSTASFSQNSVLVNFGSNTCATPTSPAFALIKDPLSATPSVLADCSMSQQLDDYFNVYIAYNPRDNRLYVADISSIVQSNIWVLDVGLPGNISCPATIPVAPNYSYSYVSNNFEFDKNGDLWSLSGYDPTLGISSIDRIDVTNGTILATVALQFPAGNFPSDVSSGDITILPNGRMFAVLGSSPSKLYEVTNYNTGTGTATAIFLQSMPSNTFGIAYLNGQLEITGSNSVDSCYYFDYNIASNALGVKKNFQNGFAPIDNTSITPAIGATKQLLNAVLVNSNTADLTYQVYVKNTGNVIINNINVTDDLGAAFGAANVSNVTTAFVPGTNAADLTLNAGYNGTTNTTLLDTDQSLANETLNNADYYFKIEIKCRVTNLYTSMFYNSAVATGNIGAGLSLANVSDSSNNGTEAVIDPNNNNNAGDVGENVPTPFDFFTLLLPVHFLNVSATLTNSSTSVVKWTVATPTVNSSKFEVEFSKDGVHWVNAGKINISSTAQSTYSFNHTNIPAGNLYYRIKQTDANGYYTYSRTVLLNNNKKENSFVIFPNPAHNFIQLSAPYGITGESLVELFDATGRKMAIKKMTESTMEFSTTEFPTGSYLLRISHDQYNTSQKILIIH